MAAGLSLTGYVFCSLLACFLLSPRHQTQCFGGLDLIDAADRWTSAFSGVVGVLVLAFVVLQVLSCVRAKPRSYESNMNARIEGVAVAVPT